MSFGPNVNDFGYQRSSEALSWANKANASKSNAPAVERALIQSIGIRFSVDSSANQDKLIERYRDAMKQVFKTFPNDDNVGTLFAHVLMLIHPWVIGH